MFLRHEGFLGALGAFMSYEKHGLDDLMVHQLVERFPMGAPYLGGNIHGPPLGDLNEKASTFVKYGIQVELFCHIGTNWAGSLIVLMFAICFNIIMSVQILFFSPRCM